MTQAAAPRRGGDGAPRIREAVPGDAVALCEVFQAAALHGGAPVYGVDAAQAWARSSSPAGMESEIAHPGKRTWVAETDAGIVGFVTLHADEVDFCYVAPAAMGRGLGGRLMGEAEDAARRDGCQAVEVVASLNAVPFYQGQGYVGVQEVRRKVADRWFDCLHMRKSL